MITVTIEEAQAKLPELIRHQAPGEELEITSNGSTIAKLVTVPMEEFEYQPRPAGTAKDRILWMAEDFNAPLDDFSEYME